MIHSWARALRPGGVLAISSHDFGYLMATEPDIAPSPPVLSEDEQGPFVFIQQRFWSGKPRSRQFKTKYRRLGLDGSVQVVNLDYLATPLDEISEMIRGAGLDAVAWLPPEVTGFFQPVALATKRPVPDAHFLAEGYELPASTLGAPADPNDAKAKFRFYPEDLHSNPFEEAPAHSFGTLQISLKPDGTKIVTKRKQTTLVMLSGGIDSVYVLYRLLCESDDDIIAHHIHFVNREGRHKAEAAACAKIVKHLNETVRPFVYTESLIDRRRFRAFGMDDMAVGFEVGVVSNSFLLDRGYVIDRWTSGTCLEEELEYYGDQEVERFEHVLNAVAASSYPNPAPRFFQLKIVPKSEQIALMGPKLTDLCWTCREPFWRDDGTAEECGKCKTCNLMRAVRAGDETIPTKPNLLPSELGE